MRPCTLFFNTQPPTDPMCINTRARHWKSTGIWLPGLIALYALVVFPFIDVSQTGRQLKAHALAVGAAYVLATLYAMYLSPQARTVRREIVAARNQVQESVNG